MTDPNSDVLRGMAEIAAYMRCSRPTVHRWVRELGLPVLSFGPGGRHGNRKVFTTKRMIDHWVMAVSQPPDKYPIGGIPKLAMNMKAGGKRSINRDL